MTVNMKRIRTALLVAAASAVAISVGAVKVYNAMLEDYYDNSISLFDIPDISAGFIPQGIAYDYGREVFLLAGYMGNGKESPVYVVDVKNKKDPVKVRLITEEGKRFKGHAGGISVYGDDIYVAGSTDACVYSFPCADVVDAQDGFECRLKKISLKMENDHIRASFTSVDESLLYVGEFHKGLIFYTARSHNVPVGRREQKAFMLGLRINDDHAAPACVYSIPDGIQGACFYDGYVYLSQSRGFIPGRILSYRLDSLQQHGNKTVLGESVPLYILTEDNALGSTVVPPMPEEITVVDGKMHILYEAASNRYMLGKWMGLNKVIATPVEYFNR